MEAHDPDVDATNSPFIAFLLGNDEYDDNHLEMKLQPLPSARKGV